MPLSDLKKMIVELGQEHGFHHVVIGGLEPLVEAGRFIKTGSTRVLPLPMDYLKRDPAQRVQPARTFPGSRSVIIASGSY